MQLKDIRDLVAADLQAVDAEIRRQLESDVALVNQVGDYIVGGGGKRLRPLLVVLAAHAAGMKGSSHIQAAALIEFIHTATLLHDDVVDDSAKRRGRDTANEAFGNPASAKLNMCGPAITGTPAAQASIRFCPPSGSKLPPITATSASA